MVREIALRFLGTSSQTSPSRNYSALLVKINHVTALVDCGESTQRQLLDRHVGGDDKLSSVRYIFITHMHQDHVLGLVPLLCSMMGPGMLAGENGSGTPSNASPRARVEIFGPSGLRALIRTTLSLTYTTLSGYYTVHELLWPEQEAYARRQESNGTTFVSRSERLTPLYGAVKGPQRTLPFVPPLQSELPGKDYRMDRETASWPSIVSIDGVSVSAAPILHRCPTVGYVFQEPASASVGVTPQMMNAVDRNAAALLTQRNITHPKSLLSKLLRDRQPITLPDGTELYPPTIDVPGRKVVVLGDTSDATAGVASDSNPAVVRGMLALAQGADVLVHESTNVALPAALLTGNKGDEMRETVRDKALARGHSTPEVAGEFAARCGARQLLLNHFSIKYAAPHPLFRMTADEGVMDRMTSSQAKVRVQSERHFLIMREIERQAAEAWQAGEMAGQHRLLDGKAELQAYRRRVIAAYDGFVYRVAARSETGLVADANGQQGGKIATGMGKSVNRGGRHGSNGSSRGYGSRGHSGGGLEGGSSKAERAP